MKSAAAHVMTALVTFALVMLWVGNRDAAKRREAPAPEQLSEPPVDVPVALPACPACGGELAFDHAEEASITDLPEVITPRVRLFRVAVHRCTGCGAAPIRCRRCSGLRRARTSFSCRRSTACNPLRSLSRSCGWIR